MTAVVIGSGLAGLTAALHLAQHGGCTLVTTAQVTEQAASMWAQGGIAAALGPGDSPSQHAHDTWLAGARIGDRDVIDHITAAAPQVVAHLSQLGVMFDRTAAGSYDLALEGGHSRHRVAHAGDRSGAAITQAVARLVLADSRIDVLSGHRATELITDARGIRGLRVEGPRGEDLIPTDRVVLATGGLGALFAHTTNPLAATGAGVALAARVGARTDDLHLVQFHPTALDIGVDPAPLLTEALRGAGAVLLANGKRFTDELQPRDVVAGAVWAQLQRGHAVVLDAREVPDAQRRFPAVSGLLAGHGLSLADLLPVRPAAHYSMGGVTVDGQGRTSVPGLWAVGEVSRTGLHGANRLASNSLLEAVVTGQAAATSMAHHGAGMSWPVEVLAADPALRRPLGERRIPAQTVREELSRTCGVLRNARDLATTVDSLADATGQDDAYVGWLLASAALAAPHSVGAHRRTDDVLQETA